MTDVRLRIGLLGAGHLGKIHLKCLTGLPQWQVAGFYDVNPATCKEVEQLFGIPAFDHPEELMMSCDALDIVSPTTTHARLAETAIRLGKHCFIEKPVTVTLEEALLLKSLSDGKGLCIQIGHVERFNPGFAAVRPFIHNPRFIEAHRLSSFNPRGRDVSVIHDLMIHDLDLICLMANSPVAELRASGVSLVSPLPDICNARIEFESGLVCNVTASRISMKQMRKLRIFQEDAYISLDMLEKEVQIIRLLDEPADQTLEIDTHRGKKYIRLVEPEIKNFNAIEEELKSFHKSIVREEAPEVNLEEGIQVMTLVQAIASQIERSQ
ncbi:MAG: Gfo/Idh/MocA family oxidoreductase [Saprospiraceae bacterium]|nr:Gfo/Idh/MocA family oxidoreductase [Saprospiraceae bacterium]